MSLYVLDTDSLSLYQRGHPRLRLRGLVGEAQLLAGDRLDYLVHRRTGPGANSVLPLEDKGSQLVPVAGELDVLTHAHEGETYPPIFPWSHETTCSTLTFTATDPDGLKLPGFGDTRVGGTYSEDIVGVHKRVLHVGGTFRLHHASRVAVLNDGL